MRSWRSKLWIPESTLKAVDATLRDKRGLDTGSSLYPACDKCSRELATRFAVEAYGMKDRGRTAGGEPYTDIYARCHGEEQIIRIEGMEWMMEGEDGDLTRIAAMGALTFFVPGEVELRIPAQVFRAFLAEKVGGRRARMAVPKALAKAGS
jgi:hypothetical protein